MAVLLAYIDFKKPGTFGPLNQMWHVTVPILCASSWYMQWCWANVWHIVVNALQMLSNMFSSWWIRLRHWFIKYNITHKIFIYENYSARLLLFHLHRWIQGQSKNNRCFILFENLFADNLDIAITHPLVPTGPAPRPNCHHTEHCLWNWLHWSSAYSHCSHTCWQAYHY